MYLLISAFIAIVVMVSTHVIESRMSVVMDEREKVVQLQARLRSYETTVFLMVALLVVGRFVTPVPIEILLNVASVSLIATEFFAKLYYRRAI